MGVAAPAMKQSAPRWLVTEPGARKVLREEGFVDSKVMAAPAEQRREARMAARRAAVRREREAWEHLERVRATGTREEIEAARRAYARSWRSR